MFLSNRLVAAGLLVFYGIPMAIGPSWHRHDQSCDASACHVTGDVDALAAGEHATHDHNHHDHNHHGHNHHGQSHSHDQAQAHGHLQSDHLQHDHLQHDHLQYDHLQHDHLQHDLVEQRELHAACDNCEHLQGDSGSPQASANALDTAAGGLQATNAHDGCLICAFYAQSQLAARVSEQLADEALLHSIATTYLSVGRTAYSECQPRGPPARSFL